MKINDGFARITKHHHANQMIEKENFAEKLEALGAELEDHISTDNGQCTLKGFVGIFQNVYTISSDTQKH